MNRVVAALFLLLVSGGASGAQSPDSSDLQAYLDEIRASGVSEMGRNAIFSVASICAGATILDYRRDEASGRYWPSYTSATCPRPDADPPEVEKWKKLRLSETDVLAEKLKPFADADHSGFVTTQEGQDFRFLIEFGYLVAQVTRDEGKDLALVARACGDDLENTERRVQEYRALARRIQEAGVTELP